MIKTILVPIDIAKKGSGDTALKLARDLAKTHRSKIILLNVVEPLPGYVAVQMPPGFPERARSDADNQLHEIAVEHGIADTAQIVVRDGHPSTIILEFARETGADMIVIASHDPGIADYLLGSVAARVVRHAHCSVLVTRKLEI